MRQPSSPSFDGMFIVLVGTRNPLNIGAAARAMSNFGYGNMRVVSPFPLAFHEAKSAVGASSVLKRAEEYKTIAEAVADCSLVIGTTAARNRNFDQPLRPLPEGARLIRERLQSGNLALLFGSEKRGLSNHDFSYCQWLMRIPTRQANPTMNLGQAVAVCLYELAREPLAPAKPQARSAAPSAELDRIAPILLDDLRSSGYIKPGANAATEQKVRRLLRRLKLSQHDGHLLEGMLRQMLWKMRNR
jgi:TrmH family RNA methyltransferase